MGLTPKLPQKRDSLLRMAILRLEMIAGALFLVLASGVAKTMQSPLASLLGGLARINRIRLQIADI